MTNLKKIEKVNQKIIEIGISPDWIEIHFSNTDNEIFIKTNLVIEEITELKNFIKTL